MTLFMRHSGKDKFIEINKQTNKQQNTDKSTGVGYVGSLLTATHRNK